VSFGRRRPPGRRRRFSDRTAFSARAGEGGSARAGDGRVMGASPSAGVRGGRARRCRGPRRMVGARPKQWTNVESGRRKRGFRSERAWRLAFKRSSICFERHRGNRRRAIHPGRDKPLIPSMRLEVFWGEISPCEHMVQFYENDGVFLDTLEGYVLGGLRAGEAVIVIATRQHIDSLERRLSRQGADLAAARGGDQYIVVEAEQVLDRFMINQWPDDDLFHEFVGELLARAKFGGRRVRAFGELV